MEAGAGRPELIGGGTQLAFFGLAFAVAFLSFARNAESGHMRFALGLWSGGVCAHLGWALLHLPEFLGAPSSVLWPGAASALFFPLGVLVFAPWREALKTLPAALFVARLGCLPYACCYAVPGDAALELLGLAALGAACLWRPRHTAAIVLSGTGALRLACEPLRQLAPEPWLDPTWIAGAWIAVGLVAEGRVGSVANSSAHASSDPVTSAVSIVVWSWISFLGFGALVSDPAWGTLLAAFLTTALVFGHRPSTPVRGAGFGIGFGGGALAAAVALAIARPPLPAAPVGPAWLLSLGLLAPVFEEVLYRGRLLPALRPALGGPGAILASSALAALGHGQLVSMPVPFSLGLVTGGLMLRTGSLGLVVGVHMGWNLAWLAAAC